jgi:hypothetical protein
VLDNKLKNILSYIIFLEWKKYYAIMKQSSLQKGYLNSLQTASWACTIKLFAAIILPYKNKLERLPLSGTLPT